MRYGLPVFFCLKLEQQRKLVDYSSDIVAIPSNEWNEWQSNKESILQPILEDVDYDRFIRQAPSKSRG